MPRFIDFLAGLVGARRRPPAPPKPAPPPPPAPQPDWHLKLVALHNEARAPRGAGPLAADLRLRAAAQAYADWLAANKVLPRDHGGPGGNTVGDRLAQAGYNFGTAGENIARGQPTPDAVFTAWMGSSGHFRNVVNPQFTVFGAGRAVDDEGRVYWCCDFAAPAKFGATLAIVYVHTPGGIDADAPPPE